MIKLAFTCGDINGIGPEIIIKTINTITSISGKKIIVFIPKNVFKKTTEIIKPEFEFEITNKEHIDENKKVIIFDIGNFRQSFGKPTSDSGKAAFKSINKALNFAKAKKVDAIITAPISKLSFNLAKINFPGHTELFAEFTRTKNFMMTFLSDKMICGLVTIHHPIKKVSKLITQKKLRQSIEILYNTLKNDLGKENPKIAVLGLNPHAGEEGLIGDEELEIIKPVIKSYSRKNVEGPFVPDAFFGLHKYESYDAVLGMYHDQVLIPFKMMNFNFGVNYTAGLPIVRTSPDHGTAFDIAGYGIANPSSMIEAVKWAELIIRKRMKK
ncbi:MAG: 4-hydroxythreonine-4-phosphate dehydrogenase PdxA [Melioribacteraceae bacterium]